MLQGALVLLHGRVTGVSNHQPPEQKFASNDASQILMLSLQIEAMALAVEDLRGRIARIERHLMLTTNTEDVRAELSKIDW
jgi:hypothetical protein